MTSIIFGKGPFGITTLQHNGVILAIQDNNGKTAYDHAADHNYKELMHYLTPNRADPNGSLERKWQKSAQLEKSDGLSTKTTYHKMEPSDS